MYPRRFKLAYNRWGRFLQQAKKMIGGNFWRPQRDSRGALHRRCRLPISPTSLHPNLAKEYNTRSNGAPNGNIAILYIENSRSYKNQSGDINIRSHRTESFYRCYAIVSERDLIDGVKKPRPYGRQVEKPTFEVWTSY